MTQKEGKCGKADAFGALSLALPDRRVTYHEDTYGVLRECALKEGMAALIEGGTRILQHVLSPDFPVEEQEKTGMLGLIRDGTRDGYLSLWEAGGPSAEALVAGPAAAPASSTP